MATDNIGMDCECIIDVDGKGNFFIAFHIDKIVLLYICELIGCLEVVFNPLTRFNPFAIDSSAIGSEICNVEALDSRSQLGSHIWKLSVTRRSFFYFVRTATTRFWDGSLRARR